MKNTSKQNVYKPALNYDWLTSLYDPLIRITLRESVFKRDLIQLAEIQTGQKILDVGCGTGTLALMIKQAHPNTEVFGVDGDQKILGIAKQKSDSSEIKVNFDHGLATKLPYPDNSFDRVFSSLMFHHLSSEDKGLAFKEIYRVLKPNGQLFIADWGKAENPLMRGAFLLVQFLDGFDTTSENVNGQLPEIIRSALFSKVEVLKNCSTIFGTLSIFSAIKIV